MPNHYDKDVYCKNCKRYFRSYLHAEEDTGEQFCCARCRKEYEEKDRKMGDTK